MRVHDHNLNGAAAAQTSGAQETQRTGRSADPRARGTGGDGDRVELSSTLASLSRALDADHAGRAVRVQELSAQYARGDYRADSAATSRAMMADAIGAAAG
jgi:anti-sigma28 factor (negative regulator of flagellin synthesis)